jgi:integrase
MLLLTAQRPNEVCGAKWEHVYWDEGIWVLPNTKNRRIHKVPITPRLKAHLKALKAISGHTSFLFPQSREEDGLHVITNKDKPLSAATLNYDTRRRFPDIRGFSSHDLRRTASTHMKAEGCNIYEIGLLLNNGGFNSVTDVYARGSDTATIGKTLNRWHRRLDKILDAEQVGNVVNLR